MVAKTKHLIGVPPTTNEDGSSTFSTTASYFIVKLLPYYSGTDNNINVASILGITPIVAGTTQIPSNATSASIGQLLKSGVVRKIKMRATPTQSGSATVTNKSHTAYCLAQNATNVAQIIGGTFQPGYQISDAWLPEHYTYGA